MAKYQVHSINEFKDRAIENNITLEDKRFFVGTDCHEPRCFGIFQDEITDEWVVYKNKSDGTRAVRYHGHDEGYAVNEIYQKLKEQIGDYKAYRASKGAIHTGKPASSGGGDALIKLITVALILFAVVIALLSSFVSSFFGSKKNSGSYYNYNGSSYYYDDGQWYSYDDGNYTETYDVPDELENNRDDYYDDIDEYNKETIDSDWDDDDDYDWSWSDSDDSGWDSDWDSGWDSGGSWDSDW